MNKTYDIAIIIRGETVSDIEIVKIGNISQSLFVVIRDTLIYNRDECLKEVKYAEAILFTHWIALMNEALTEEPSQERLERTLTSGG